MEFSCLDNLENLTHSSNWVSKEFDGICFWDKRLNKRLITITQSLSEKPGVPINQAFNGDWTDTKAAYEFFNNEKVSRAEILKVHTKKTLERAENEEVILAINDTTSFNFTTHTKLQGKGLIAARNTHSSGFLCHHVLLLTPQGIPLGEIYQDFWTREKIKERSSATNAKLPIEEKESYKWLKALHATAEAARKIKSRVIVVGDRESDLYEYFLEAKKLNQEFVVRAQYDRSLDNESKKLWEYMSSKEIIDERTLHIKSKGGRPERRAELTIRHSQVTFKSPNLRQTLPNIVLDVILVREKGSLEESVEWMLITNIAVKTKEEILEIIKWYSCRWGIEEYHKIIKTGCKVESCRLEDMGRLLIFFTIISIIAWRIFYMTRINYLAGDEPCTNILNEDEWKALYCIKHKTNIFPAEVPKTRDAIRWIAGLGGFLGRKGDGEPGIITTWRGLQRLNDIVESWKLFRVINEKK